MSVCPLLSPLPSCLLLIGTLMLHTVLTCSMTMGLKGLIMGEDQSNTSQFHQHVLTICLEMLMMQDLIALVE